MKKAFLFALTLLICLCLYACGDNAQESTQSPSNEIANQDPPVAELTEPHAHCYTEWEVVLEASCTAVGEEARSCTVCGVKEAREVAQLAHTFGDWTVETEATCANPGKEVRVCACGGQEERDIPVAEHSYVKEDTVEPTPDNPIGTVTNTCTVCGDCYSEQVTSYGSEGLIYKVIDQEGSGGICKIVAMGNCTDTELVIPKYIDGYRVVEIGNGAFLDCDIIISVAFPDSIVTIGAAAFENCSKLKSVSMQDGVLYIGNYAFHWCLYLSDISIPETVQTIGERAFRGLPISNLVIPNSVTIIGEGAFESCEMTTVTLSPNITVIPFKAFNFCLNLTSIELPEGVTEIGGQAFYHCPLTTVTIPATVTYIDNDAFWLCTKLTQIHFLGTMEQWENMKKSPSWDNSTGYYTVYCNDGVIEKNVD